MRLSRKDAYGLRNVLQRPNPGNTGIRLDRLTTTMFLSHSTMRKVLALLGVLET